MTTDFEIRLAEPDDLARVIELCRWHAEFERCAFSLTTDTGVSKQAALSELLFAPEPRVSCLVAEMNGAIEGYATYMRQYSTWDAGSYVYLDCLFLTENTRRMGIGRAMLERVREEAIAIGCGEVQWQTPEFNVDAIRFYEGLGAVPKPKQRFTWKVTNDAD